MKTLLWKIRYALEMRKVLRLSPVTCWEYAGIALDDLYTLEDDPIQAVADEVEEWRALCS